VAGHLALRREVAAVLGVAVHEEITRAAVRLVPAAIEDGGAAMQFIGAGGWAADA
jgi:hypothetical protein